MRVFYIKYRNTDHRIVERGYMSDSAWEHHIINDPEHTYVSVDLETHNKLNHPSHHYYENDEIKEYADEDKEERKITPDDDPSIAKAIMENTKAVKELVEIFKETLA